jgi:hypothetical protein
MVPKHPPTFMVLVRECGCLLFHYILYLFSLQNIGVRVVFFFNGVTPESNRHTWKERRQSKEKKIFKIFVHLDENPTVQPYHIKGRLPSVVAATGSFVAKYVCGCDVYVSVSDCDVEMAHFAQKENCFAILSQDTDFVILQGARHLLTVEELNLETMTTRTYSREGLLKDLELNAQQLCLLASLLGNDIIPFYKVENFHERLKQNQKDSELLYFVRDYIKEWNFSTSCDDDYDDDDGLREIAKDVFGDDRMASDLANSIKNYLSPSTEEQEIITVADTQVSDRKPVIALKCPMYQTLSSIR